MARQSFSLIELYGYDLFLGSIAAFYVFMVPYTKVEESFNIQAMHDILYHRHHIENYDHLEFPGVVPRTFIGSLLVSILASPFVSVTSLLQLPKIYSLFAVRLALGCIILFTLRFFRVQIRDKFGRQVEAFFVIFVAFQFHMLFYCTRPLPNILALGLGQIFATIVFRCDILLLLCPLVLVILRTKSISVWKALKFCVGAALFFIGLTMLVDTIIWRRPLWPEFEVFSFNSVLNRSSERDTQSFHCLGLYLTGGFCYIFFLFFRLFYFTPSFLTRSSVSLLVPFQSLTYQQQLQLIEFTTIGRRVSGSCFI